MERLTKYANRIDNALGVLRIIIAGASAISFIMMLAGMIFAKPNANGETMWFIGGSSSFTSGILKVSLHDLGPVPGDLRMYFGVLAIMLAAIITLLMYAIGLLKRIMGEMREGRPFSETVPVLIRKIAYVIFAYAAAAPALSFVFSPIFLRLLNSQHGLLDPSLAGKVEIGFQYEINILAVFAGFAVLLLSLVFEYGARLQRESDETL